MPLRACLAFILLVLPSQQLASFVSFVYLFSLLFPFLLLHLFFHSSTRIAKPASYGTFSLQVVLSGFVLMCHQLFLYRRIGQQRGLSPRFWFSVWPCHSIGHSSIASLRTCLFFCACVGCRLPDRTATHYAPPIVSTSNSIFQPAQQQLTG